MNIDVLIKEIEDAFHAVEYPGDNNIIKHPEYAEPYEMLQALKGKHWNDITLEMAEYWRMNTGDLTSKAFHYFVPAFLIAGLHEDSAEVDLYLMYQFIPPDENAKLIEFNERFSEFDESQREAISKFIMRFLDNNPLYYDDDEKKRMESFWKILNS